LSPNTPVIAYLFTTFPNPTETFLQREVIAMRSKGVKLKLYSMWGGSSSFRGIPVECFSMWRLFTLIWLIPYEGLRRPKVLAQLLNGLYSRRAPSWINFWENMLGAGFACIYAKSFRKTRPDLIHATWGGAPATAAWILAQIDGHRYSAAAHAYDLFEHGGDWWLNEKLKPAVFVHTSTHMGKTELLKRGIEEYRIQCIRRGLDRIPPLKPLRSVRLPLRLLCIARLVEKKGIDHQLRIYAALKTAGIPFKARIVGEGALRNTLEKLAGSLGVAAEVTFEGHLKQHEVWTALAESDVLLHTGVIAPSGDRDGLPNVIPEAMSIGVLVVTSPTAATTEAITDKVTGLVAPYDQPLVWVEALSRLAQDDTYAQHLRNEARAWVITHFDAHNNAARLYTHFLQATAP
jgi:glycosyltransferase involved in cell wall biosynthesis